MPPINCFFPPPTSLLSTTGPLKTTFFFPLLLLLLLLLFIPTSLFFHATTTGSLRCCSLSPVGPGGSLPSFDLIRAVAFTWLIGISIYFPYCLYPYRVHQHTISSSLRRILSPLRLRGVAFLRFLLVLCGPRLTPVGDFFSATHLFNL